jgi:hypothetical protein
MCRYTPVVTPRPSSERTSRFVWEHDDVEWLTTEQAVELLGDVAFVPRVARELAKSLSEKAGEIGIANVGENSVQRPLLLEVLKRVFDSACVLEEQNGQIPDWDGAPDGKLGGVDVVITQYEHGPHRYLMELKWCQNVRTLGWTLWDAYKMASGRRRPGIEGSYLIVGAPVSVWDTENAWGCGALFANGRWRSADIFQRWWIAWLDLLGGGLARPSRVPAEIVTRLLADEPIATGGEPWSLRVLAVEPLGDSWLGFDGDWPTGSRPRADQVTALNSLTWTPLGAHTLKSSID